MSLRSMWRAARLARQKRTVANAEEPIGYRERFRSRSKIIMRSRIQDHHGVGWPESPLVAQCISTGPGGDCGTPFFPDDSDVRATEPRPISVFRAFQRSSGRGADLDTGWEAY
jgi:hypothetical protein